MLLAVIALREHGRQAVDRPRRRSPKPLRPDRRPAWTDDRAARAAVDPRRRRRLATAGAGRAPRCTHRPEREDERAPSTNGAEHAGHGDDRRRAIGRPDDPGRVQRQVDEVERRRSALRRDLGREQAEDHRADRRGAAASTTASSGQERRPTGANGIEQQATAPPPASAATRTGRNPTRSPSTPPSGADERPDERRRAHAPARSPTPARARPDQRPRRRPAGTAGSSGSRGTTRRRSRRSAGRPGRRGRHGPRRTRAPAPAPPARPRAGPRASRTRRAAPSRPTARPTARTPPRATSRGRRRGSRRGPARPRTRSARTPRRCAMTVPSRRSGVTSRMPASITPVLPSWNPISSMLRASCHGSRDRATPRTRPPRRARSGR